MIKLEELDKKTRLDLVRGCEPFYITYRSPKWQNKIVKSLCEEFGAVYEVPIRVILTAASKSKRYGLTGTQFTLDFMKFKRTESKTKKKYLIKKLKN